MLLWDREMRDDLKLLEALRPDQLLAIALAEIERSADIVIPASSEAREIYATCVEKFREAQNSGGYMPVLDDELGDELREASESPEWGVGPLLAAMDQCVGEPATPMTPDCTAEVLSLCYQAVMEYQQIDDITPETERQYPALLETIQVQKNLIHRDPSP
jgi:hypothetical protein